MAETPAEQKKSPAGSRPDLRNLKPSFYRKIGDQKKGRPGGNQAALSPAA
jgi:hypothetical protein